MARTGYGQQGTEAIEALIRDVFDLGGIGYVALAVGQEVLMREAPGLVTTTTPESNFYEELLVNPTLLKLASQRAGLDCGGLRYVAIGYGDFVQLIMLMRDGHISVGTSKRANAGELAARVGAVIERHGYAWTPPATSILGS